MLWHLTSKFCVLSCKLVLAWEPWENAGGTATGSPSWVRCPIRGKDFFLSVAGFFHYYIFIVLMLIFFLALHSIQGELYIHKMGAFLWKLIKTEADRQSDCQRRYSNPSICSFPPRAPDLRMVPFWSVDCFWFVAQQLGDIYLFLWTNWSFFKKSGVGTVREKTNLQISVSKYTYGKEIKLFSYIFIRYLKLIVIQLPD